ncbi:hypothetical protein D187_004045 [Cystobacter fuscus DSM 2262]|uniref:Uncharacterized protein n=1 Tax=Cystobacter fuscus (strain ATCC 25194 / DSM 2262 / NBRC 100088 / M29) TaxID=1242864 RepID=S9QAC9_CYSF2|nr:hypothetical protein [Cystobacter fuscus]EPX58289.1 hypothetical protein D187_004045 [Cystobacter fuscus DSM 2262]
MTLREELSNLQRALQERAPRLLVHASGADTVVGVNTGYFVKGDIVIHNTQHHGVPNFQAPAWVKVLYVLGSMLGLGGFGLFIFTRLDAAHPHVGTRVWAIEDALRRESDFIDRSKPDPDAIAYPLPEKPWTKQAVPPCETNKGEVEINKGCWVALEKKPPCFSNQAEYQGKCCDGPHVPPVGSILPPMSPPPV